LKEQFTKEPVLAAPDIDKKIRMEVDTSDYAIGGGTVNGVRRWVVEASGIFVQIVE